jgi:hypothetical protein
VPFLPARSRSPRKSSRDEEHAAGGKSVHLARKKVHSIAHGRCRAIRAIINAASARKSHIRNSHRALGGSGFPDDIGDHPLGRGCFETIIDPRLGICLAGPVESDGAWDTRLRPRFTPIPASMGITKHPSPELSPFLQLSAGRARILCGRVISPQKQGRIG